MHNKRFVLILSATGIIFLASCQKGCDVMSRLPTQTGQIPDRSTAVTVPSTKIAAATPAPSQIPAEGGWCSTHDALDGNMLIIGYIPEYRSLDLSWGNCLTDIIYFSLEPKTNGELDMSRFYPANFEVVEEIKRKYGTRIHVSLGGYGRSDNFGVVVTDSQKRGLFIDLLIKFAADHDLDGIDFDWEFPETQREIDGYIEVLQRIKDQGLIVSVALYPSEDLNIIPYLVADRIQIMSYNRGVRHSTYQQAIQDLDFFISLGAPKEKLILGIPFYGRQVNSPYHYFTYAEIAAQYQPAADVDEVADIYFNGMQTVMEKTCYTLENGYGGVMVWELGQDNGTLIRAIHDAVASRCKP
ncbi:MAG: glycoside hydrolase family 18 protein [Anaerolineaceae bacterium]|nr:glycoside hydrolase family 18 protein [Anaerolineaceae bacterium]